MNEFESQIPIALLTTNVIEWSKKKKWIPFAEYGARTLNAITAGVTALIAAGVLHYTFDNDGNFSITGNLPMMGHVLYTATVQYALQHFFFKTTVAPPPAPILTEADIEAKKKQ